MTLENRTVLEDFVMRLNDRLRERKEAYGTLEKLEIMGCLVEDAYEGKEGESGVEGTRALAKEAVIEPCEVCNGEDDHDEVRG